MGEAVGRLIAPSRHAGVRRRFGQAAVFAVLVGLWLMHGMSGTTDAGCHGVAMPLPGHVAMSAPAVYRAPAAGLTAEGPGTAALSAASMGGMRHGELCLSGQPPRSGGVLLVLLMLLAVAGYLRTCPALVRASRRLALRWRAPQGRAGTPPTLLATSSSR